MVTKKSSMQIKRGRKSNLPLLKDGQLAWCKDSKELFIGSDGKNELVNEQQINSGGGNDNNTGTVTAEYLKLLAPNGREFKVTVTNDGELSVARFVPESTGLYPGLIINQVYGGGVIGDEGTAVTHGFIELYNDSTEAINLNGLSVQYAITGMDWKVCELSGSIKPYHSYLIRANRHSEDSSTKVFHRITKCDKDWAITMYNKGIKVCLIEGTDPLDVVNPYKEKVKGYIDMIGCGDSSMDAAEGLPILGQSKQKSIRRKNGFIDTQDNELDCEIIDYRLAEVDKVRPRYSGDGAWNEFGDITTEDLNSFLKINQVYAGGSDAACSHHFVELYNTHQTKPILLDGISLYGAHYKDANWQHIPLKGTLPPRCSFLIRGVASTGSYKVEIGHADIDSTLKLEKGMKVFLIESADPAYLTGIANPFNSDGAWKKVEGYIDGFGCHGNSGNNPATPGKDMIDGFETEAPGGGDAGTTVTGMGGNSKQTSMRRINFQDTDINSEDFEPLRYANYGIDDTLTNKVPRWLEYGPWEADDIFDDGTLADQPFSITNTFGADPCTTRTIRWFTKKDVMAMLMYGIGAATTSAESTTEVDGDYAIHTVKLTGLTPASTYMYKVSAGTEWSATAKFVTSSTDTTEFNFVQVTDSQGSNSADFQVWGNALTSAIKKCEPDFLVHTGDHIEDKGDTRARWDLFFAQAKGSIMNNALVSIPGNNDLTAANDLTDYKKRFAFDNICPSCDTAYHFEYGNTFFLCLDSNRLLQEQKTWANEVLGATDKKWKIVLIHAAPYTAFKEDTYTFAETLEAHNVDLVLCGHKHMYMRSFKMKNDVKDETGITYIMGAPTGVKENSNHVTQPWMDVLTAPGKPSFNEISITAESIVITANKIDDSSIVEIDTITLTK